MFSLGLCKTLAPLTIYTHVDIHVVVLIVFFTDNKPYRRNLDAYITRFNKVLQHEAAHIHVLVVVYTLLCVDGFCLLSCYVITGQLLGGVGDMLDRRCETTRHTH